MPEVAATDPLNAHFARDVSCIYAIAGAGLMWRSFDPVHGWAAALAGAAFLTVQASMSGRSDIHDLHLRQSDARHVSLLYSPGDIG